ncbi:hypothetical protein U9M48_011515 [Paspalum notatum var. saurae]|uniref:F-box domain-containing protein n=1 Tax=Paspalum notatum var. saurae TaxID=547442 RepID=A0AAQ3SVK4_PASNO
MQPSEREREAILEMCISFMKNDLLIIGKLILGTAFKKGEQGYTRKELGEEILLRPPPQEPAHLCRAALVCKAWRSIICDSSGGGFPRRYREFHRTPSLLGYLKNAYAVRLFPPQFVPATSSAAFPPLSATPQVFSKSIWRVLDCRHGRALIADVSSYHDPEVRFVVWDHITRDIRRWHSYTAAVLCAVGGCDHLGCHGGPFHVVLVEKHVYANGGEQVGWATMYSSETHAWSAASRSLALGYNMEMAPSLLIGDALYFTFTGWEATAILKYTLDRRELSVIGVPGPGVMPWGATATKTEDGGLGFVVLSTKRKLLYMMSWEATGANGSGRWARHRTLELGMTFPHELIGYVDGMDTVLVRTDAGVFTLDLKSRQSRKVAQRNEGGCRRLLPYTSFFTPGTHRRDPLPPAARGASNLVRAALVCKAWRSMLSDAGVLRRYREFHGTPPLLGYLHITVCALPRFISTSTTPTPLCTPVSPVDISRRQDHDLDCRHSRVLTVCIGDAASPSSINRFIVWDPITGGMKHVNAPCCVPYSFNTAVLCAVDSCDHRSCHGGPLRGLCR